MPAHISTPQRLADLARLLELGDPGAMTRGSEPRIFHYTVADRYNQIQQDRLIKPPTEAVPPGERPECLPVVRTRCHYSLEVHRNSAVGRRGG